MYIYGKRPVREALRSAHTVEKLIVAKEMQKKDFFNFRHLAEKRNIPFTAVPKSRLQKYCGPVVHQGIVAELAGYTYTDRKILFSRIKKTAGPVVLILDQVQDTHNMGAIIRTAEICGVTAIIIPEKTSADINPTVAKTSAGAVFHCNIHRTEDLNLIIGDLKKSGLTCMALMPGRKETIFQADLRQPLVLIIGSEGSGVRKNLLSVCDMQLSIPRAGRVDSLNVSVSTGIALFEIMRQRLYD
jgi:23S rRNA (guanosine2251-2'-O)-methyltransferase